MGRHYRQLGQTDGDRIKALHDDGYGIRKISRTLGISHSTISWELWRNSHGIDARTPVAKRGTYDAAYANPRASTRRKSAKYQGKKITEDQAL